MNFVCIACGKEFVTKRNRNRQYCSQECFQNTHVTKKPCPVCGTTFNVTHHRKKYCSQECYRKIHATGEWVPCKNCGKLIWKQPNDYFHGNVVHCSRECSYQSRRKFSANAAGYMVCRIYDHPLAAKSGIVFEHWLIYYDSLKTDTEKSFLVQLKNSGWQLHHRDVNRAHNVRANLELRAPGRHPHGWSVDDMIKTIRNLGYLVVHKDDLPAEEMDTTRSTVEAQGR